MRLIASLIYVAAAAVAASRAVAINRVIEIIDLAIGIGRGDEIKYLDFNGVIHEKELQFFCLETQDLTLAPFRVGAFFFTFFFLCFFLLPYNFLYKLVADTSDSLR